jgi:hypothetical protein
MPISVTYEALVEIARNEFSDAVNEAKIILLPSGDPHKVRLDIADGSFVDVFISISGRYSFHWERRLTPKGDLYRHDNAPHRRWRHVLTYPKHFNSGSETNVVESHLPDEPPDALRELLRFVRQKLLAEKRQTGR